MRDFVHIDRFIKGRREMIKQFYGNPFMINILQKNIADVQKKLPAPKQLKLF